MLASIVIKYRLQDIKRQRTHIAVSLVKEKATVQEEEKKKKKKKAESWDILLVISLFVTKPVAENCICAVCLEVMCDPMSLRECGHTFCKECIDTSLTIKVSCPTCRVPVTTGTNPNFFARDTIDALQVRCPEHYHCHKKSDDNGIISTGNRKKKRIRVGGDSINQDDEQEEQEKLQS